MSDPHVADDIYFAEDGVEGNARDTTSMRDTVTNLTAARDLLNPLAGVLDAVFVPGDVVHNYPTVELGYDRPEDMAFDERTRTRFEIAAEILNGFEMPVFVGRGNHDYDVGNIDRAFSEELLLANFNAPPYYAVDHRGVRVIHLNNFRGATQGPGEPTLRPRHRLLRRNATGLVRRPVRGGPTDRRLRPLRARPADHPAHRGRRPRPVYASDEARGADPPRHLEPYPHLD